MKKLLFTLGFVLVAAFSTNAQDVSSNAIGLRFSGGNGLGGEVSYQAALGGSNRLEVNLGLANEFSDFKATGLYEWVFALDGKFNWYVGAGAGIISAGETGIYGAGVIGIEYNFDIPLLISIDYRPEIGISGGLSGIYSDVALALRYQF
ncbi:MAG: hypothetical protein HWD82_07220 [Flavobacteriaceae bacterium]|nr:hypothetical protein [Flavobacteriaceae bacterium]